MQIEFESFWESMQAQGVLSWREGVDLEFKTAAGQDGRGELPHSLWETYSAMANTDGGVIVLGVKELRDGSLNVQGVPDSERVTKDFWNVINNPNKISVNLLKTDEHHLDVSDALKRLVDGELLKSEGRGTSYRLFRGDELLNEPLNHRARNRLTRRIYEEICQNPGINQKKLYGLLSVSAASVKRHIELLNGRVEHRGSKKTGGYYICEG